MDYFKISCSGGRESNEDCVDILTVGERTIFAVADGLGGNDFGEIASKQAVEAAKNFFRENADGPLEEIIDKSFREAHIKLKKIQKETQADYSFKTTLSILLTDNDKIAWGHVGDTRIYRFENGGICQHTMDHSVAQLMALMGEIDEKDIRKHPKRNKLTRVLGDEDELMKPMISCCRRNCNDSFLICTDGFWECIRDEEMGEVLNRSESAGDWLKSMMKIITEGNEAKDNISAIAVML